MKRIVFAVLLGICSFLFAVTPGVRGQTTTGSAPTSTPTPAPTLTPTPVMPSGEQLLTMAQQALQTKGSAHLDMVIKFVEPQQARIVVRAQEDVSFRNSRARESGTMRATRLDTSPHQTTTSRIALVVVGRKTAARIDGESWTCGSAPPITATASSLSGAGEAGTPTNLGLEMESGAPAWHVRQTLTISASGLTLPLTEDVYIAQADNTFVREMATGTVMYQGTTLRATVTVDYSKYGEPVRVKLPKICRTQPLRANERTLWQEPAARLRALTDASSRALAYSEGRTSRGPSTPASRQPSGAFGRSDRS